MKQLMQWFYERPYRAKNQLIPEKKGFEYVWRVCKGMGYWVDYEVSLWKAWGAFFAVLGLGLFLGTVMPPSSAAPGLTTAEIIAVAVFIIFLYVPMGVAVWASVHRLMNWIKRTPWAMALFFAVVFGFLGYSMYSHPAGTRNFFQGFWNDARWIVYIGAGSLVLLVVIVFLGTLVRAFVSHHYRNVK